MDKDVIYSDVSMKKYNSWRVGGLAEYYVEISSEAALQKIFSINKLQKPITVIGVGSNLLIRDGGIKGTVINLSRGLKNIFLDHHLIFAECGISCSSLARFSAKNNKKNCAFLAGIPGSVGGALAMNAGCYGGEIWQFVSKVKIMNHEGDVRIKDKQSFEIGYRSVKKKEDEIFIGAWFNFPSKENNDENEEKKIDDLLKLRRSNQPLNWPTAGSTFRNPEQNFAAKLIEEVGLKGFQIGDARISNKHANFIENVGDATAKDIEQLIYHAQDKVEELKKIRLQLEVKIIGENVD
ncbi:MAG: UDP-N-acetylmuramate dehydrogenase [Nitrosomonadales bacterium]|nr:UDP-N-acetylmuramate dehydrogenase [Nitrosomonadales bacterium]